MSLAGHLVVISSARAGCHTKGVVVHRALRDSAMTVWHTRCLTGVRIRIVAAGRTRRRTRAQIFGLDLPSSIPWTRQARYSRILGGGQADHESRPRRLEAGARPHVCGGPASAATARQRTYRRGRALHGWPQDACPQQIPAVVGHRRDRKPTQKI